MKTESIKLDIDVLQVAAKLAHCGADVQGKFLNVFVDELKLICETEYKAGLQMAWVADEISKSTKEMLEHLTYKEAE